MSGTNGSRDAIKGNDPIKGNCIVRVVRTGSRANVRAGRQAAPAALKIAVHGVSRRSRRSTSLAVPEALVAEAAIELFDVRVLIRFAGFDQSQTTRRSCAHVSIARPQNSSPLSVRMTKPARLVLQFPAQCPAADSGVRPEQVVHGTSVHLAWACGHCGQDH